MSPTTLFSAAEGQEAVGTPESALPANNRPAGPAEDSLSEEGDFLDQPEGSSALSRADLAAVTELLGPMYAAPICSSATEGAANAVLPEEVAAQRAAAAMVPASLLMRMPEATGECARISSSDS